MPPLYTIIDDAVLCISSLSGRYQGGTHNDHHRGYLRLSVWEIERNSASSILLPLRPTLRRRQTGTERMSMDGR